MNLELKLEGEDRVGVEAFPSERVTRDELLEEIKRFLPPGEYNIWVVEEAFPLPRHRQITAQIVAPLTP